MLDKICSKCKWAGTISAILIVLIMLGIIGWLGMTIVSQAKSYTYIGQPETMRDTITISGEGKVTAIPDIASVRVGVITEKEEVADAQKENTDKVNKIIKELKSMDVESKDIKTTSYNIYPKYDYSREGSSELIGYTVDQQLTIKIRKLDDVGEILGKVGELGANQIGSLQFTIDDQETLKQEAREKALENAKEKAEALAEISGVKLGKIVSFSESSSDYDSYYPSYYAKEAVGLGGVAPAPDIEMGNMEISIYATVSYEIK